ncbi:hydantoinase/oxoprolinase family protein [Cellulomonas triticagri]|uniref:Hydantoinase/oxoprolinase family protein n=1 Tax=Cellulomonas triticagri TaxID=2483352 RepID=A0A3M2J771_9CELL|nr:hydantoinase/oxoprolinase family protein [Cellulomonas triticagri]RMI09289.1 hydantoinase/oxoprolinase family protein [Cellulomonas triticagri]
MARSVRMGIDVGGTHTKAVAIDNATQEIIGKSSVKTTHHHPSGVAAGVVLSFRNCLRENAIDPRDVVFVAHSTTQATNALIEGDVARVGVVGIAKGGLEGWLARRQTRLSDIDLSNDKYIRIVSDFLPRKQLTPENLDQVVDRLTAAGAQVLVASMAFGVDDGEPEAMVHGAATDRGIPTTMASDITKLYGLTRRTRTAAINASILPKMLDTATSTETAVREAGVTVPLMIMRGDGGVMEIAEMKKRPVLTMLSGPAASVMGSLMYLRASNGVYFEVGGTTTNIGVIRNGRPTIDYSVVGGHPTYISSLDVQVVGCAGGSMIRADRSGVVDVGPRSAHIAELEYAVYTDRVRIRNPRVVFFSPREGDPADYVKIVCDDGVEVAITNSCAANVLGLVSPDDFSYGDAEAARAAMAPLADHCGLTVEEVATQIMERAYAKINPIISGLAEKYRLEEDQISLVGVGGGAASLIPWFSATRGVSYSIPQNSEVISSIGVALAMVRDVVERIIPSPSKEEIQAIKNEALNKAVGSGATPESVEIHVEIDPQTSKVTAIATGSTEVKATDLTKQVTDTEALELAAADMRLDVADVGLLARSRYFRVYGDARTPDSPGPVRIVDERGFIKVQRGRAEVATTTAGDYLAAVEALWESMAVYRSEVIIRPELYACLGARVADFAAEDLAQLTLLVDLEMSTLEPDDEVILVAGNVQQT